MANRQTKRYDWNEDDFEVSAQIDLPDNLQSIVDNAPEGDQAIAKYLKDLMSNETITADEVNFLLDSGIFK